jgi:MFS transporter, NNP family, nitrate/nitrite transporter
MQVWKKFSHYKIEVDEKQDDKAVEILLCSFARPHMRYASETRRA